MTLEVVIRRIVAGMTPEQRAEYDRGCQLVDFYMGLACDPSMPAGVAALAREKLRAFALRKPGETVADIDGKANQ